MLLLLLLLPLPSWPVASPALLASDTPEALSL
jgi:hypothetical protein